MGTIPKVVESKMKSGRHDLLPVSFWDEDRINLYETYDAYNIGSNNFSIACFKYSPQSQHWTIVVGILDDAWKHAEIPRT